MFTTLIVEDNVPFRHSLKDVLHRHFPLMNVVEAADAEEGLEKVRASHPDLIFIDIELPGENGLELTKRIRTDHAGIPVVILTSYDLPEYREAAYDHGANYFFSKATSTTREILALVESITTGKCPVCTDLSVP